MSMEATLARHMTIEPERSRHRGIATLLPWIIAGAALILYGITLNHWVVFDSLPHVAKLSGYTWQPERSAPVYWTLTYAFRWLPGSYIPLALNVFAAVCGALVLALLARSVMLLPHDRTVAQRERERSEFGLLSIPSAWVPPVLAVLVCGLQISFWENATAARSAPPMSASAQILDLLMFAYVVRCLLEFRVSDRDSWLFKAALVYGMAMTNDWGMYGYLPAFIVALIWIKGVAFFNGQFLVKLILWGFAGLLFYLVLPIAQTFSHISQMGFWAILRASIGEQMYLVKSYFGLRKTLLVMSFTSLLPVFLIGIRWSTYFGDTSRTGALAARLVFHFVHGLFLAACVWMAFDPPVSPRNQDKIVPFLSFYYLGALAVGYLAGYFLLVFGPKRSSRASRPVKAGPGGVAITWAVLSLLVLVPIGLLSLNLPRIRIANSRILADFAQRLAQGLPEKAAVILSDDPRRLVLLQTWLAGKPGSGSRIFLHTGSLPIPDYHAYLKQTYGTRWGWEVADPKHLVPDIKLLELAYDLSQTNELCYLHPSFGYFFEIFYPEPHGVASHLRRYPERTMLNPRLTAELLEENESFWKSAPLQSLASHMEGPIGDTSALQRMKTKLRLRHEVNSDAKLIAGFYAQSLNAWGAELQRHDRFQEAGPRFKMAYALNPDNIVARVNSEFNERYIAGQRGIAVSSRNIEDEFGKYRSWTEVINANGPFDEPGFCYSLGLVFAQGNNLRQAAQNFDRARTLGPENVVAHLWLADMYTRGNKPDEALKVVNEVYANPGLISHTTNRAELLMVEATAYFATTNYAAAAQVATRALERWPQDSALKAAVLQVFFKSGNYDRALPVLNELLAEDPLNPGILVNKGFVNIQLGQFREAIAPLTRALNIATNNHEMMDQARFNRAVANLRAGELEAAKTDYEALQQFYTNSFQVHFGLAEIAYQHKDKSAAISHYEQYLANSPTDSPEVLAKARERLQQLRSGAP